jgi:hypothetical protein
MSFGDAIQGLISSGYSFRVRGFFNVEGGQVGLSNMFHEWCDCMSMRPGPAEACDSCTRKPRNYVSLAAGDGDGIYVVAEIVHGSSEGPVVGALAVFDNRYRTANAVRAAIEVDTVPEYPVDLALLFSDARPLALGPLENTGVVLFADSGSGINPREAVVDVHIDPKKQLSVFSFVESVSTDPQEWVERLCSAQGQEPEATDRAMLLSLAMGESIFESMSIDQPYSLPPVIPRALIVLDENASKSVNLDDEYVVDDWELLGAQFAGSVGSSHTKGMGVSTVWMNALLAIEWDRVAGEDLDYEETKRLLFDSWTWAYQGILLDDDDCRNIIARNHYRATPEEVSEMLRRRGFFEAADKALAGDLPYLGLDAPAEASASGSSLGGGLTKTSGGSGLSAPPSTSVATPTSGIAKFCTQCGAAFANETAKFCSSCGSARN